HRSTEPSLEIFTANVCVKIEHTILGAIQVDPAIAQSDEYDSTQPDHDDSDDYEEGSYKEDNYNNNDDDKNDDETPAHCQSMGGEVRLDPIRICISDSILDATDPELEVLGMPGCPVAHVVLTLLHSTVFGQIQVHAIELGENCIFDGRITVARRQQGCLRFCYVTPESRTPRRYRCQPDLVKTLIEKTLRQEASDKSEPAPNNSTIMAAQFQESVRVRPGFNSVRYGNPTYCQLAECCADEIKRGADDESEMGVFHHLYQPQRMANLSVRLNEYLPAHMDVGIIVSS
ncbi:MAG: hypothetical protein QNL62_21495, partial [Gammaproteobacteria bacterium]|nr:hypothetical protein [Gammaproteobacteria bacterium]